MTIGVGIGLGLAAIAAIIILANIAIGFKCGLGKSTIKTVLVILAAVIAFLLSVSVARLVSGAIQDVNVSFLNISVNGQPASTIKEAYELYTDSLGEIGSDIKSSAVLSGLVDQLPVMVIAILIEPIFFIVLTLIAHIIYVIFNGAILRLFGGSKDKKPNILSRLLGMAVRAVCGVIVAGMVVMPLLGGLSVFIDASKVSDELAVYGDDIKSSFGYKWFGATQFVKLGNSYIRSASTYNADETEVVITDEVDNVLKIYGLLKDAGVIGGEEGQDPAKIAENAELIHGIKDIAKESVLFENAFPILMKYFVREAVAQTIANISGNKGQMELPANIDLSGVTVDELDKIVDVYDAMNEKGLISALSGEGDVDFDEVLSDEEFVNTLAEAAKDSEVVKAVIGSTVTVIVSNAIEEHKEELPEGLSTTADLAAVIDRESLDTILDDPSASAIIKIANNDEVNDLISKHDGDHDSVTSDDISRAIDSILAQYGTSFAELIQK